MNEQHEGNYQANHQASYQDNYEGNKGWMRILFTALFWLAFYVTQAVILAVVIAQAAFVIFAGGPNHHLLVLGDRLTRYVQDILRFVTFNTDKRPFPFDDFPKSDLVVPQN